MTSYKDDNSEDETFQIQDDEPLLEASEMGMAPYEYQQQQLQHEPAPEEGMVYEMDEDRLSAPGEWNSSLFGCFSSKQSCLLATCCTCLSFGRSSTYIRTRDSQPLPEKWAFKTICNPFSVLYYAANVATMNVGGPVMAMWRRHHIRQRYGIKGNIPMDILTHFCCHCCALVQEDVEVMLRETEKRKLFRQEQEALSEEMGL